jgi:amino acid permease
MTPSSLIVKCSFIFLPLVPFALYNAGFISGLALSVFVSVVSQLGLYMLVRKALEGSETGD